MIDQYKLSIVMSVNRHYESQMEPLRGYNEDVDECLEDAQLMKEDILSSLEIIQQVEHKMFRKVMESYKSREQSFKDQVYKQQSMGVAPMALCFLTDNQKIESILQQLVGMKSENRSECRGESRGNLNPYRLQVPSAQSFCGSMSSENENPIIQESSGEEHMLKNNLSNNESYFKEFE